MSELANPCKEMVLVFFFFIVVGIIVLPFSVVGAFRIVVNSEGKTESEGTISTHIVGTCGQDYRLVTPENADIWEINITITSELSTQPVHIRIYEVIGEYPYNYEEQTDVPYARGTGTANLVVLLNASKIYEIWIRDAYAKQFTGTIRENWHPYVINGDFETGRGFPVLGWITRGHIGRGSSEYTYQQSTVVGVQQEDSTSYISQEIILDRDDLIFSFWFRPDPEVTTITFQALFDDIIVYEDSFSGSYFDHEWRKVIVFLEPFFEINEIEIGDHSIEFRVPASDLPHAAVEIDEVTVEKVEGFEKIGLSVWCEANTDHIDIGDSIEISGSILLQSNNIVSLAELPLELEYRNYEGSTWGYITSPTITQDNDFHYIWTPVIPGEYIVRAIIPENNWFLEFEAWTEPLSVGSIVSIDSYEVSNSRCDVDSPQYVKFHVSYSHNGADAEDIIVVINGTEYVTDESGWIQLFTSSNTIGKSVWNIDSIVNVDGSNILIDDPAIIWDEVELRIESPQRISVNSDAIQWSGKYIYNDESFDGSLVFNDTLSKSQVGRYPYRVMGILDIKYNIGKFSAHDFQILYDNVALNISLTNNRIDITDQPEIAVTGYYEYDHQFFSGTVNFVGPIPPVEGREFSILVESIEDPLYGLTSFTQNEVTGIFDQVIIELSLSDDRIDVGEAPEVDYSAYYEYDSQPFMGSIEITFPSSTEEINDFTYTVENMEETLFGLETYSVYDATCIWDRIKITESGVSNVETAVKRTELVWYKAEYEYDSELFDGSDGLLYLNNVPMEWSDTNQRWEKTYISDTPKSQTFTISGVHDDKYGLTQINDVAGKQSIEWKQQGIPGFPIVSIFLGLALGFSILKNRAHNVTQGFQK